MINKIKTNTQKILILDRATTNFEENLVNKFKANNSTYLLIPPGLTRYIQPLDVVVNKPIKTKIYNWDTNFRINNLNMKKPNEIDIIEAINDIWYNNNDITKEMIIKSSK